jgi:hypothetical protein
MNRTNTFSIQIQQLTFLHFFEDIGWDKVVTLYATRHSSVFEYLSPLGFEQAAVQQINLISFYAH